MPSPVNVAPTSQSREASEVVNGATGSCVSSLATTVSVRPSDACAIPGGPEGTTPVSGGGPTSPTGTAGGGSSSAKATPAVPTGTSMQTAATVAKRFNMS